MAARRKATKKATKRSTKKPAARKAATRKPATRKKATKKVATKKAGARKTATRKKVANRKSGRKASGRVGRPSKPPVPGRRTFGNMVREMRQEAGIGLREMSEAVGMSPAYLSMVERDELAPPAEDKVKALADMLGQDHDTFLTMAGRLAPDLSRIMARHPKQFADLIRALKSASEAKIAKVVAVARKR